MTACKRLSLSANSSLLTFACMDEHTHWLAWLIFTLRENIHATALPSKHDNATNDTN